MYRRPMPEEDTPLVIPYFRDPSDRSSHSYVNLKLEPEREVELPELQKNSVLRDVVLAIKAQTNLQTFGCEIWLNPQSQSPWPEYPEYTFQAGSYLDLAFTDDRRMSREAYNKLIDEFIKSKTAKTTTQVGLQHKVIMTPSERYFGVIWWNWGLGRTQEEAENSWALGIRLFKEFVLEKYPLAE